MTRFSRGAKWTGGRDAGFRPKRCLATQPGRPHLGYRNQGIRPFETIKLFASAEVQEDNLHVELTHPACKIRRKVTEIARRVHRMFNLKHS
jgi:hypothetical protein